VQRELGEESGEFFRRFYQPKCDEDPVWLLRPNAPGDILPQNPEVSRLSGFTFVPPQARYGRAFVIHRIRASLASAEVLADDVLDLFDSLDIILPGEVLFLGGHEEQDDMHPANRARLERLMRKLDGDGIFRRPVDHGIGAPPSSREWAKGNPHRLWQATTHRILHRLLVPDPRSRPVNDGVISYCLPIATSRDRRAALRSLWCPILPEFEWSSERFKPSGRVNIYLDVSGSMVNELNLLIGLLWKLRSWIRSPFHAFSNGVSAARIVEGKLQADTTGGTCFNDVLQHILEKRPGKSLVITDGYIEQPDSRLLNQLRALGEEIHVLVSSDGNRQIFENHSIPCTQLPRIQATTTP
jgi:hypothetical protein